MHPLLELAHGAIAAHLDGVPPPAVRAGDSQPSQGVFVTLFGPQRQLRGCIGRMRPIHDDLGDEVASCAIAAAMNDPRFSPVQHDELPALEVEISLIGAEEPIDQPAALNPELYGIVVRHEGRTGVLLPEVQGIQTVEQQLNVALRKGGIDPRAPYALTRFTVEKIQRHPAATERFDRNMERT